jgi:hypothetical protein
MIGSDGLNLQVFATQQGQDVRKEPGRADKVGARGLKTPPAYEDIGYTRRFSRVYSKSKNGRQRTSYIDGSDEGNAKIAEGDGKRKKLR